MKNFKLNLKGLCRSSQLALNSDGRTTVERRSTDGHSRRHLPVGLTKLLSLFFLLTLGVGQMWAGIAGGSYWGDIQDPHHFYFEDIKTGWYGDADASWVAIMVGRNFNYGDDINGSTLYTMEHITNTKLYYRSLYYAHLNQFHFMGDDHEWSVKSSYCGDKNTTWGDCTPTKWGDDGKKYTNAYCVSSGETFTANYFTYCTPSGSANNSSITLSPKNSSDTYTALNKTITIKQKYNSTGDGTYEEVTSGTAHGTITVSGYAFNSWNSCPATTPVSITKETSTYSANAAFGRTSTVTLTAGETKAGKAFVGWYRSDGTLISTNTETTIVVGSADEIVYAYYKDEETHDVTVSYKCGPYTIKEQATESAVGIATTRSVTAPDIAGYHFVSWTLGADVTSTNGTSTNPITINSVHNGSDFTLTANYGVSSGWYLIGTDFGNTWTTTYKSNQFAGSYRGRTDIVYYPVASLSTNYWKLHDGSNLYNTKANEDQPITTTTVYSLSQSGSGGASKVGTAQSNVWIVIDKRSSTKKLWVQDQQTYHNVNVTGEDGAKGAVSVTLNSTSAFGYSNISELATTQFANGETFKVTVTGVSGWIPTITIGGTPTPFWKEAASYEATGTMSTSDVTVSISYTASYAVTFAKTTGCGTLSATGPYSTAISTGNKVKSGTSITFTQTSTHSGYDFSRWNSASTGDGGDLGGNASGLTKSITATTSVYPIYTVHTYTGGTLDKKEGSEAGSYSVTYLATSFASKTDPTRTGYNVEGYYKETERTTKVADASGNLQKSTTYTDASNRWIYTSSIPTLYTKWTAKNYSVTLDKNGSTSGYLTNGSATATYDASSLSPITAPTRTGYHVEGYYDDESYTHKVATDAGVLQSDVSGYTTGTAWTRDGEATLYAKWSPNTYTISFNADDASRVGTATNVQANVTVTYDAKDFSEATVDVPVLAGYTFGGYYTATNGGGEQIVDANGAWITSAKTGYLDASGNWIKAANTTLYAKWTPKAYTATLNHGAGTCATTSTTVTMGATYGTGTAGSLPMVTPPSGYTFDGWYTAASGGSKVESSTQVTTASDHTLYAHFVEISYVYFYNNLGWENVYVVFNAEWVNNKGTGCMNSRTFDTMERIGGTNIWRHTIPEYALATEWQYNIAFSNTDRTDGAYHLYSGKAIFRTDFDSYATMFVPATGGTTFIPSDYNNDGQRITYYSTEQWDWSEGRHKDGLWMKYNDTEAGYVLKGEWDGWSNDSYFRSSTAGGMTYTVTKALPANTNYEFLLYKHCKTDNTHTSTFTNMSDEAITTTTENLEFTTQNAASGSVRNSSITTTAAGDYVFTLTCGTDGTLKLSVTYPLTVDQDYRVLYSWNDGSAHTHASEIIHKEANTSKKISVFVHKAESPVVSRSLTIQKCTAINASGNPTWSDVNTITLPTENITANGVYNFVITQPASGEPTGAYSEPYTGEYYVRADATSGGWDFYKEKGNIMKYSAYSLTQTLSAPYSHYYCMFVNTTTQSVAFTVATEYSPSICDTLGTDAICTGGTKYNQKLPATANVRFSWNEQTNALHRSYLKNATGDGNERFLVLHGSDSKVRNSGGSVIAAVGAGDDDLKANELLFSDEGDWVYRLSLQAQPGAAASIMARYNNSEQYLVGGASSHETILGGSGGTLYDLKATYDFKTNRLIVAWTPPKGAITDALSNVDMLWVRHAQESAQEITFGEGGSLSNVEVVGAIEFKYNELIGYVGSWNNTTRPLLKYFISFPFDVEMSDIFGLTGSVYGREYVIQKYNGAERAEKGLFLADDGTFWQDMTLDETMHKGEGYCLIMDNDYLNDASASIWTNKSAGSSIFLYFPAKAPIKSITNANENTKAEAHQSYSDRWWIEGGVRKENKNTDSHWNLIGSPLFANSYIESTTNASVSTLNSYYTWNSDNSWSTNTYNRSTAFNAMSCILVQWYGDITWTTSTSASVTARRTSEKKNHTLKLELLRNEEAADWAFVEMRDGASSDFVLCEDMMKIKNSGKPNLYLYAGNYDVAYSQVPVETQTVPVGVIIRQNGTYTFSMPSNFDGTVTLIDKFAQTRTNLALGDYEVALERGTINDRFELEINIRNVPTAIDGVTDGCGSLKDGKAHKFIENGAMYILREGQIYDARGNKVK